jgi:Holliday junction resolvasome RuvABC endonuclease subunit
VAMRLVGGLDPSLSNFGMAIAMVDSNNFMDVTYTMLITTKTNPDIQYKNLCDLRRAIELSKAMKRFFCNVDSVYVEIPIGSQSARAMASYGICIGILAGLDKRIIRVSAKEAKVAATGNPQATKKDMVNWATNKHPEVSWLKRKYKGEYRFTGANEHVADAIATIYAGLKRTD